MSDRTREQIGDYHLLRFLGSGNFADVYLGQHLLSGSYAAIKVLRTHLTQEDINDFLRETRLAASLVHPHIVRIFDCGVQNGTPFVVLDYAPGGTLRQKLPRGTRLAPGQALYYLKQIADGLQYAHDRQIIHRDVKPENMFLGPRDEVMLGDFSSILIAQSSRLQSADNIVGTVSYIAPEQIQGKPKFASDQYALGIVTYQWLTGELPFTGTFTEVIGQHMVTPPAPLRTKVADLPQAIEQVVLTTLAKDPQQRFPSVRAFFQAFELACQEDSRAWSISAPPISTRTLPPQASPTPSAYVEKKSWTRPNIPSFIPSADILSSSDASLRAAPVTSKLWANSNNSLFKTHQIYRGHQDPVRSVVWSADGQLLASGGDDASFHLWQVRSGQLLISYPGHGGPIRAVTASRQGMLLASGGQDAIVRIWLAYLSRVEKKQHLFQSYNSSGPIAALAWSPRDLLLASCDFSGMDVLIWEVAECRPFTTFRSQSGKINALAWSPDGSRLAAACANGVVQVWQLGSSEPELLCQSATTNNLFALVWSPDGRAIAAAGDEKVITVWTGATGRMVARFASHRQSIYSLAWSPDGRFLASSGSDHVVHLWDASAGRNLMTYTGHVDDVMTVAWSPDGHFLASAGLDSTVHVWQPQLQSLL